MFGFSIGFGLGSVPYQNAGSAPSIFDNAVYAWFGDEGVTGSSPVTAWDDGNLSLSAVGTGITHSGSTLTVPASSYFLGTPASFDMSAGFTVALRLRHGVSQADPRAFSINASDQGTFSVSPGLATDRIRFTYGGNSLDALGQVSADEECTIICKTDVAGGSSEIWKNGSLQASALTASAATNITQLRVGHLYDGAFNAVALWDTPSTDPAEVHTALVSRFPLA